MRFGSAFHEELQARRRRRFGQDPFNLQSGTSSTPTNTPAHPPPWQNPSPDDQIDGQADNSAQLPVYCSQCPAPHPVPINLGREERRLSARESQHRHHAGANNDGDT